MKTTVFILVVVAVVSASKAKNTCEMRNLLDTNQFAIFAAQACHRNVEIYPTDDGYCPKVLKNVWANNDICPMTGVQAHLLRDIYGRKPPMILYLSLKTQITGRGYVHVEELDWPSKTSNASNYPLPEIKSTLLNEGVLAHVGNDPWKHSIFDTRNRFLYVITNGGQFTVYIMLDLLKRGKRYPEMRTQLVHENIQKRSNFIADPYAHMVYYTERQRAEGMDLYVMPMEDFMHSLDTGAPGTYLTSFADDRKLVSVSDGILVSRTKGNITTMFRDLKVNGSDVCICEHNSFSGFDANFLIVRDWDYCMARFGNNREYCDFERNEYLKTFESPLNSETDWRFISIWILLALLFIFLVLFIYSVARITHYRSKYADSQEKVQFLQDQVATALPYYPTNVGYSSEMDVTVDRY